MRVVKVIKALSELAFGSPEYIAAFNDAMAVANDAEQEVLQRAYNEARARSDAASDEFDAAADEAKKKK